MSNAINLKTKRFNLTIFRQRYRARDGSVKHTRGYYYCPMVAKQRYAFPLGPNPKAAATRAEEIWYYLQDRCHILQDAIALFNPRKASMPGKCSTLEQVIHAYERSRRRFNISEATVKTAWSSLMLVLRRADAYRRGEAFVSRSGSPKVDYSRYLEMRINELSAQTLYDFQDSFLSEIDEDDLQRLQRRRNTANSLIGSARSYFSRSHMDYYRQAGVGLRVPEPESWDFLKVKPLVVRHRRYRLPPYRLMKRILEGLPDLKMNDLNAWRAAWLILHAGLRRKEAGFCRWGWWNVGDVVELRLHADGRFMPKAGHEREVVVSDFAYQELWATRTGSDCVLDGDAEERLDHHHKAGLVFQRLTRWLRGNGLNVTHPVHELRSFWFSSKVKIDGLLAAQQQGGHFDANTTSRHYADSQMPDSLKSFWEEGIV